MLDELARHGRIEPSMSSWASPIFVVSGDRMVIDFRKVNDLIDRDSYPLPRADEFLDAVRGAKVVSTFDLKKGFYQIPIDPASRQYTAFISHRGLEQLTVAAMGYKNSPPFFQRKMDEILRPWSNAQAYMDDLVVFSPDFESHVKTLREVLTAIEAKGLTLSPKKAHVGYSSVSLLGHRVGIAGLSTDDEKVDGMINMPIPRTVKALSGVIGLFGYYRHFIPNFAQIAQPLYAAGTSVTGDYRLVFKKKWADLPKNEATKKIAKSWEDVKQMEIHWTPACDVAFSTLKEKLKAVATLAPLDPESPLILYTDASYQGYGVALHQVQRDAKGKHRERPIAFHSRSLRAAERNYWPTELELGCVVYAFERLHKETDGRPVTLVTDHSALRWILQARDLRQGHNSRLTRWALFINSRGNLLSVVHRPGLVHTNVDALSRLPRPDDDLRAQRGSPLEDVIARYQGRQAHALLAPERDGAVPVLFEIDADEDWRGAYTSDKHYREIYAKLSARLEANEDGPDPEYQNFRLDRTTRKMMMVLHHDDSRGRLCVPDSKLRSIIRGVHEQHGHPGVARTFHRVHDRITHPKMFKVIREVVQDCASCQHNTTTRHKPYGQLQPITPPALPFHTISIDWVVALPRTSTGLDAFLSVTDKFTKTCRFIACKTTDSAVTTARRIFSEVVRHYGLPSVIIGDRDTRLTSRFFTELARLLGVRRSLTTAYHPQADGQSERTNQTVEIALRHYVDMATGADWDQHLESLELAYNTSKHASTGFTPYELLYGHQPNTGLDLLVPSELAFVRVPATAEFVSQRQAMRDAALDTIAWAQMRMAGYYDARHHPREFKVGDRVLLRIKDYPRRAWGLHPKLGPQRIGPFRVLERIGQLAYRLELPGNIRIHPVVNVAKLEPARGEGHQAPLLELADGQQLYILESIHGERPAPIDDRHPRSQFLVKWRNMPEHENTWEDENELIRAGNGPAIRDYRNAARREQRQRRDAAT